MTDPTPDDRPIRLCLLVLLLAATAHLTTLTAAGSDLSVWLRESATVEGDVIRLADVADVKGPAAASAGQTVVGFRGDGRITPRMLVNALADAGFSRPDVQVAGAVGCDVTCAPSSSDDVGLLAWAGVDAGPGQSATDWSDLLADPGETPAPADDAPAALDDRLPTLAERLSQDAAERLGVDRVGLTFRPQDASLLARRDVPATDIAPQRLDDLGRVSWVVRIDGRPVTVPADAATHARQLVAARPVARGQVLREQDVIYRDAEVRSLAAATAGAERVIGHAVSRDLVPGEVISPARLAPQMLARRGQAVTVTAGRGALDVRTRGRALEDGAYGQTIRVRTEGQTPRDARTLHVRLVAAQEAVLASSAD